MVVKKRARKKVQKKVSSNKRILEGFSFLKPKGKIQVVFKNFILFVLLTLFSYIGYKFLLAPTFVSLFGVLYISFAGISVAFLIVFLVMILLNKFKK
jgi:hypothetical protein